MAASTGPLFWPNINFFIVHSYLAEFEKNPAGLKECSSIEKISDYFC